MEIFFGFIVVALLFWVRNSLSSEIRQLRLDIRDLQNSILFGEKEAKEKAKEKSTEKPVEPVAETKIKEEVPEKKPEEIIPTVYEEIKIDITEKVEAPSPYINIPEEIIPEPAPQPAFVPLPKKTFAERYPDLEKFIGENLINKLGIGILVLGIAYFVKYAIDKNWIPEIGRVAIGIFAGGILIAIAHRLHKKYRAFSSVLVGGGLATLYFTIAIAFHQYQIFSQTTAFVIMAVITAFAVALSIGYNKSELAVLAIIGGFASPFIVSTGEGNYIVLFTYLLILNCGMLVLAYRKKWNIVNILCYLFTIIIYGSWLVTKCLRYPDNLAPYKGALAFGAAFYFVFFLMNIIYNVRNRIAFKALEIGILVSNTFLFYSAGMAILHFYYTGIYQGLFTASMGVFNAAFAFAFYRNKNIDKNIVYLLIGMVLTFLSLTAPIQLEGNYITLFWSAEAVLLLWFSQKSGIKLAKITSVVVNGLMFISLIMDWSKYYIGHYDQVLPVMINRAFITSLVSFISVTMSLRLMRNEPDYVFQSGHSSYPLFKTSLKVGFVAILYFMFLLELNYQLSHFGHDYHSRNICVGIYNFIFLIAGYFYSRTRSSELFPAMISVFSGVLILCYIFVFNDEIITVRDRFLQEHVDTIFFILHFLLAGLMGFGIFIFRESCKRILNPEKMDVVKWVVVFLTVYVCSAELNHIALWISYDDGRIIYMINKQIFKAGYTVLWGIISLLLMQQGMSRKDRMLRVISLTLFFVTILKLFLIDIKDVSETGRILAFISLGILLLVTSFMYQRLKTLILKDEANEALPKE